MTRQSAIISAGGAAPDSKGVADMRKYFVFVIAICIIFTFGIARAEILPTFLSNLPVTGGHYWFVGAGMPHSSDDNPTESGMHSWQFPLDSTNVAIDAATAQSTTSGSEWPGDVIVLFPGHTETVDAVTDIVPDKAGLYFYGLGEGDDRPTITISTAVAASILISGADNTFENIIFKCTYDDTNTVTSQEMIDIGALNTKFKKCKFWSSDDGTGDMIQMDGDNTANGAQFIDCEFVATAGTISGISAEDTQDGVVIRNCKFFGDYSTAPIYADEAMTNMIIEGCYIENDNAGDFAVEMTHTSNTGFFVNNMIYTNSAATAYDCDDMWMFGNKFSTGVNLPSVSIPMDYSVKVATCTTTAAATTDNMFDVGGPIVIIHMFGQSTAAASGSPGTMTIEFDATTGADYDNDLSTTVNVDALGAGDAIRFTGVIDEGVLTLSANVGAGMPLSWICGDPAGGVIEQTLSSTGTLAVTWYMVYIPLTATSTVAAST
jgi:hypothetical protein